MTCPTIADAVRNASFVVIGNVTSETVTSSVMYAEGELECRALGNPEPTYNFTTEPASALDEMVVNTSRGHVRLSSSLIGRNLTLHCSAVNVVDSVSYSDNVSVTFAVLGELPYRHPTSTFLLAVRLQAYLLCVCHDGLVCVLSLLLLLLYNIM